MTSLFFSARARWFIALTMPVLLNVVLGGFAVSQEKKSGEKPLDESPVQTGEWGYRPDDGKTVAVTPPSFVWRPNKNIVRWELAVRNAKGEIVERVQDVTFNVHTPSKTLAPGEYLWTYRGFDKQGNPTVWSRKRTFTVPEDAKPMPLPPREELLGRIPATHPRIFVRPEGMGRLRDRAKNELAPEYKELVQRCEQLLKQPPDTTEPPRYKDRNRWKDELDIWWGNRTKTIAVLENAALLAFVWNLGGDERFAELSKKLLLAAAEWDPKGATGYWYNDEAGMPYNYHFSRTYTFLNAKLTEEERQKCRDVMKIRGDEMYRRLCPNQLWKPYGSHPNRAWHFLGEIGLAFQGEIPGADDWVWFAMNVFYATYPAWCDDDGGWHEGALYWNSYQSRFCWWADAMRAAFDINAFDKPYYSQIGFYPIYLAPPGKAGGCLGDLNQNYKWNSSLPLVDIVAMQSGNPYWRWYVEADPKFKPPKNYYTFLRKAAALDRSVADASRSGAKAPTDLPKSKWFRGTGLVMMNTSLLSSAENVQLQFKSTPPPFGSHSHGYDANNSYIFSAWNENLLINSGRRDYYGSPHHKDWMWSTRSENNITVDGVGQLKRSQAAVGEIVRFESLKFDDGDEYDLLVGEASEGYRLDQEASDELRKKYPDGKVLDRFRRNIVFLKPDLLVVYDRLQATRPATFEYRLHAVHPFQPLETYFPGGRSKSNDPFFASYLKERLGDLQLTDPEAVPRFEPIRDPRGIGVRVNRVACRLDILLPENLTFTQTNQYDPNPQPKIKVREWHLTAKQEKETENAEFLMVARPWKVAESESVPAADARWERTAAALVLHVKSNGKDRIITFPVNSDELSVK